MKNTCIVCGGEEFFLNVICTYRNKIGHMHQTCIDLKKVFIEHRDEENYPVFQEITAKHCCGCGHIMLYHE